MTNARTVIIAASAMPFVALAGPIDGFNVGAHAANLGSLGGAWSGGGKLRLAGGKSERLRCRAYYNPKNGGKNLGMAIRCASTSYKIELRSRLQVRGSRVSGSWEERNFNATGTVRGSSRPGRLALSTSGGVNARLFISYGARRQNVRITGDIGIFKGITLVLRK
ncbi:MAG: hypothetical protein ACR2PA_07615 [Hyphomicrobiaceae bacterium]